jgi:LPS sulfotransferase NodH
MKDLRLIDSVSICTYPRSGSVYLSNLIVAKTGYQFPKYHYIKEGTMIVVVRNPLDSIISEATKLSHYDLFYTIDELMEKYVIFYSELIKNHAIIFQYEDLLRNPEGIIKTLIKELNITEINETPFEEVGDNVSEKHIATSTKSPHYDIIKEKVKEYDFAELNKLYEQAKNKALKV